MEVLHLGIAMRERRLAMGLSQEKVCSGICETITLSRFESGKQTPSHNRIKTLLQRLGMPDDRYFALLSSCELELQNTRNEVLALCGQFEQADLRQKKQAWDLAMEQVHRLDELAESNDNITHQFILFVKALLGTEDGPYSLHEQLALLHQALLLTVPNFDLNKINAYRYSVAETRILTQIAIAYSSAGKHEEALSLYCQIYDYVHANDQHLSNYAAHFTLVAYNYARELSFLKFYSRAVEVISEGIHVSRKYRYYQFLPGFMAMLGEYYHFMDMKDQSLKRYVQAHYLYEVIGDECNLKHIDAEIQKRFHFDFPV